MSKIKLTGANSAVVFSQNYKIHAPGMHGIISDVDKNSSSGTTRGTAHATQDPEMESIFKEEGVHLFKEFVIEIQKDEYKESSTEAMRSAGVTRSTPEGEMAMVLNTPKTRDNMSSAILHTDEETGLQRWIFPEEMNADDKEFTFLLPRKIDKKIEVKEKGGTTRGVITAGIRRIVKVFAWMIDPVAEAGVLAVVKKWEERKRPYALNMAGKNTKGKAIDWEVINGQPTLLLLHGTFSTWQDAFYGLFESKKYYDELDELYEGRIIAFNHPSLHKSPAENVEYFLENIPDDIELKLDIITHSRGGLVGRELCERMEDLNTYDKKVSINKAIFVAAPHQGTILANKDNWRKLIDTYTNLLVGAPDTVVTILLESIITLVKVVGGNAVSGLPGLNAMLPNGDHLKRLNTTPKIETQYYAIGADYKPTDTTFAAKLAKLALVKILDKIFNEDSDLVVPTQGCFTTGNDNGGFPIPAERQKKYNFDDNIHHVNFFNDDKVNKVLYKWLKG